MDRPEGMHLPHRPDWSCKACGEEWPCATARTELAEETGGGTALAMLLWSYLEQYAEDVGPGPLTGAFDRFIAWSRSKPLPIAPGLYDQGKAVR